MGAADRIVLSDADARFRSATNHRLRKDRSRRRCHSGRHDLDPPAADLHGHGAHIPYTKGLGKRRSCRTQHRRCLRHFFRQRDHCPSAVRIFHHSTIRIDIAFNPRWPCCRVDSFCRTHRRKKYISLLFIPFVLFSFWAIKALRPGKDIDIKYYSEGLLGQLLVADVSHDASEIRPALLLVNRMVQTVGQHETLKSIWDYVYYVSSVCSKLPEKSNALILGLGGGTVANIFQNNLGFNVDAVELDERIAEVARDYFALGNNVNIIVDDARHYLEETQKQYDVIFFDVYRGELPPPHVFTLESLIKAKSLLKENGLIVVNFNGFLEGKTGRAARSIYKTLLAAGLETRILPTPGAEGNRNHLVCGKQKGTGFPHRAIAVVAERKTGGH